jgi:hypothetical protein
MVLKAITAYEDFEKVCPAPVPPKVMLPGGKTSENIEAPEFKKALEDYANKQTNWMYIKSLEPSNIGWDTVNIADPSTYENWEKDLLKAGLTQIEITRIKNGCLKAQGLDSEKIEKAKKSFLASRSAAPK